MSKSDLHADKLNNALNNIFEFVGSDEKLIDLYFSYKELLLLMSQSNYTHSLDFNSPFEWTLYSILEDLVPELCDESLMKIFRKDTYLYSYIQEWCEMDGFVAKLKYRTQPSNLDRIKTIFSQSFNAESI